MILKNDLIIGTDRILQILQILRIDYSPLVFPLCSIGGMISPLVDLEALLGDLVGAVDGWQLVSLDKLLLAL